MIFFLGLLCPDKVAPLVLVLNGLDELKRLVLVHNRSCVAKRKCSPRSTTRILELAEGTTLAERIAQGPIPLEEAIAVASSEVLAKGRDGTSVSSISKTLREQSLF